MDERSRDTTMVEHVPPTDWEDPDTSVLRLWTLPDPYTYGADPPDSARLIQLRSEARKLAEKKLKVEAKGRKREKSQEKGSEGEGSWLRWLKFWRLWRKS